MRPTIRLESRAIVKTADLALLYSRWILEGIGPDGGAVTFGWGTEVLRRQTDGTWLSVP
jgi:ketosteroid isomerase-like protein